MLSDVLGPGLRLLLVGINPGRRSAELGQHFAGHGNRFWPALHDAGLVPERLGPADQERLPSFGVGLTNLVARPSARANELTTAELRAGAVALRRQAREWCPVVVAVLGITAYRRAFDEPGARLGLQVHGATPTSQWWVLPNPSGLNAHAKPADHAAWLQAVARAAGLHVVAPPAGG